MAKILWSIPIILVLMGSVAFAQPQSQPPEKAQDVKKEDPVPPATDANKQEQGGKLEPSSKVPGTDGNPAAFANGTLTAPGALVDVDTAPSKFSSRTAADDQLPTAGYRFRHLSAAQRSSIYGELGNAAKAGSSAADAQAVVGAQVPLDVILGGLQPLPDSITTKFPEMKGLAFAMLAGKPTLVDPTTRIVVDVGAQ
jgi:hypothetical protein